MSKDKSLIELGPVCENENCSKSDLKQSKKTTDKVCGSNLKVVTVTNQIWQCLTCGHEISTILSAKEN